MPVNPPEVVDLAVDEKHRNLIRIHSLSIRVNVDINLRENTSARQVPQLGQDRCHDNSGVIAQMTARAPNQGKRMFSHAQGFAGVAKRM